MGSIVNATGANYILEEKEVGPSQQSRRGADSQNYRRRTLQSLSELGTVHETPAALDGDFGSRLSDVDSDSRPSTRHNGTKPGRPKSMGLEKLSRSKPSIRVTSPDTPPTRSFTAPTNLQQSEANVTRDHGERQSQDRSGRLSVNFSFRRIHASDEKDQLDGRQTPSIFGVRDQGKQSTVRASSRERHNKEVARRQQAVSEAKARRASEGHGITLGSSSKLPSMSPLPVSKPSLVHIRGSTGQQQLLQNSRSMGRHRPISDVAKRRSSGLLQEAANNGLQNDTDAQLLKRASTNSMALGKEYRRHSLAQLETSVRIQATPHNKRSSRVLSQHKPMPLIMAGEAPMAYTSSQSQTTYPFPRPPSGVIAEDEIRHLRDPSPHRNSFSSSKSNTSRHAPRPRQSSVPQPGHKSKSSRHQRGVTQEHLDALAALTAPAPTPDANMTPQSLELLDSQQKLLEEKIRRHNLASEQALRAEYTRHRSRSRASSTGRSRRSGHSYGSDMTQTYDGNNENSVPLSGTKDANGFEIQGLTPDSVRLLREREKLLRWKAEREKLEFEKREREKIRQRVQRANELEEERTRNLELLKKERRGCCGFLGL
ncbi:hypothetical protein EJ04DRAFT_548033 [Polyplosphaeria fusca]|uniref:Uncharacterized protein n=1 Tax=Polyplosphaeria fusca TaxID=682080 RepID=A0A9P4R8P8_9PLEO|nr:hypothetical protein EJ04DRAFT_548033 [Polyplosphaeria fusca]